MIFAPNPGQQAVSGLFGASAQRRRSWIAAQISAMPANPTNKPAMKKGRKKDQPLADAGGFEITIPPKTGIR
jgi:hypothetical protein